MWPVSTDAEYVCMHQNMKKLDIRHFLRSLGTDLYNFSLI